MVQNPGLGTRGGLATFVYGTVRRLISENKTLKQNLQEAESQLSQTQTTCDEWRELNNAQNQELERIRLLISALESKSHAKDNEMDVLREAKEEAQQKLEEHLADLRTAKFDVIAPAQKSWFAVEDSRVRDCVSELYKDVRAWAKSYAIESPRLQSLKPHLHRELCEGLCRVGDFSPDDLTAGFDHPFLLLAALLSEHVRSSIFQRPFFIFEKPKDPFGPPGGSWGSQAFSNMYDRHPSEALKWSVVFFRSEFPQLEHAIDLNTVNMLYPQCTKRKEAEAIYKSMITSFLFGPARPLMLLVVDGQQRERDDRLYTLLVRAGNLCMQLHY